MGAWYENDAFWTEFGPILFDRARQDAAPEEVEQACRLAGLVPGTRVLDLACGPGRHCLELARRGYLVTGVDRNADYLAALERSAAEAHLDVEVVNADMREFRREDTFDAVLSMFTSLGYFEDPADDLRVLEQAHASLVPGGRVVIDVVGREVLARGWQERYWTWLDDKRLLLEERRVLEDWSRVRTEWTVIEGEQRASYRLEHRLYAGTELAALLRSAGFRDVRLCGALDGRPYDREAWRLVAVGTR